MYIPFKIGYGGALGICCGVAFKRVGTAVASMIGVGFAALQLLAYFGYIQIDNRKIRDDVAKIGDINGDGKLDAADAIAAWNKLKSILGYQLPGAGGFSAGVAIGLYLA
jgi:uncharacterized membrane protein (Fun14 family)